MGSESLFVSLIAASKYFVIPLLLWVYSPLLERVILGRGIFKDFYRYAAKRMATSLELKLLILKNAGKKVIVSGMVYPPVSMLYQVYIM